MRRARAGAIAAAATIACGLAVAGPAPAKVISLDGAGASLVRSVDPFVLRATTTSNWISDGTRLRQVGAAGQARTFARQHGPVSNHLPAVRENVELVSKLKLKTPDEYKASPSEPDLLEGQIADVAIYKNTAYLNS
jgi:hypothetical protein